MSLPEFLSPPPEKEAIDLALDALVFDPVQADEDARTKATDTETPPMRAFLLLDASINPDIPICAEAFPDPSRCLFDGAAFEELAEVGPWLIEIKRYGDAWDWYVSDGWGNNWGIIIHTRLTMAKLKTHLKKFIKVEDEDGETYFFKYYRPEHLNTYLPAFDADQQARFMKGIDAFSAEKHTEPGTMLQYALDANGALLTSIHDLVDTGMPLRIQPPSEEDVAAILAKAAETS